MAIVSDVDHAGWVGRQRVRGGMGPEAIDFLEACIRDTPVMVTRTAPDV